MTIFKAIILFILFLIILSLAASMFSMVKDGGKTKRTVNLLTVRITLSVIAFVLLVVGMFNGWISPHGIMPTPAG